MTMSARVSYWPNAAEKPLAMVWILKRIIMQLIYALDLTAAQNMIAGYALRLKARGA